MIKKIILLLIIVFKLTSIGAQISDDFIRIDVTKTEGLKILQERSYTKESLFGYMNGGAELYLEYGFDRVVVSDVSVNGNNIKVEAYRMPDSDKAFGIYSVNIFKCGESESITEYYCQSDYQIQFCKGNYYVNIINNSGLVDGLNSSRIIAEDLIKLITEESFALGDYIPDEFLPEQINKLMLVSGKIALGNNAYKYSEYVEGFSDYNMVIVESDTGTMLILRFEKGEQLESFRNSMGIDQFPVCGEKVNVNGKSISLTNIGDIIIHIDAQ